MPLVRAPLSKLCSSICFPGSHLFFTFNLLITMFSCRLSNLSSYRIKTKQERRKVKQAVLSEKKAVFCLFRVKMGILKYQQINEHRETCMRSVWDPNPQPAGNASGAYCQFSSATIMAGRIHNSIFWCMWVICVLFGRQWGTFQNYYFHTKKLRHIAPHVLLCVFWRLAFPSVFTQRAPYSQYDKPPTGNIHSEALSSGNLGATGIVRGLTLRELIACYFPAIGRLWSLESRPGG